MIKIWISILLIFMIIFQAIAQTPAPTPDRSAPVTVDQGFVDDAAKAFAEVKALRDSLQSFLEERGSSAVERSAAQAMIKGLNDFLALKDRMISQYELMNTTLMKVIEFQNKIIQTLMDRINKPKGKFRKILDGVKLGLQLLSAFALGRMIGGIWINQDHQMDVLFGHIRPSADPDSRRGDFILQTG